MDFVNNPEVEELKRRVAVKPQSVVAHDIGLSEAMLSYVLADKRTIRNPEVLKRLGCVRKCYTVTIKQAPKLDQAYKEIVK